MMMFDTHCHLNFKVFKNNLDQVIREANKVGVSHILVPGTDVESSKKGVEIAEKFEGVFAAVGIHPHNVYKYKNENIKNKNYILNIKNELKEIERLSKKPKVVAIGEVGIDRHIYEQTKYTNYQVDEDTITLQKELFKRQIELAVKYNKSLIIHNREAIEDVLPILERNFDKKLEGRTVFHCCEPQAKLLDFTLRHKIYIGVDGDITYNQEKQIFIKKIPLEHLVLETDSPFLLPESLKSQKKYPNVPANLKIIADFIAGILKIDKEELVEITFKNSVRVFLKTPF